MKNLTLLASLCLSSALLASAALADSNVEISNTSSWEIHEFYLSPIDKADWGPDQLKEHVIATGGTFELQGIPCDSYDVKLVDEDADECIVGGVKLCDDAAWVIDDQDLLHCQKATEEQSGDDE